VSALKLVLIARIPAEGVSDYQEYEAGVLPLLGEHEGKLERRLRDSDGQLEVHVIGFASRKAFKAYMDDPQRTALKRLLIASGARTELHELHDVSQEPPT
jgi:hypothetical protein